MITSSIATRSDFPCNMGACFIVKSLETEKGTVTVQEVRSDEETVTVKKGKQKGQ